MEQFVYILYIPAKFHKHEETRVVELELKHKKLNLSYTEDEFYRAGTLRVTRNVPQGKNL